MKSGEMVIIETDKKGKFDIQNMENYMAAGMVHTSKDEEVTEDFVKNIQRVLNGHYGFEVGAAGGAKMTGAEVGAGGRRQPQIKIQTKNLPP